MNPLFEQRQPANPVFMSPEQLEQLKMLVQAQHEGTLKNEAKPSTADNLMALIARLVGQRQQPEPQIYPSLGIRG